MWHLLGARCQSEDDGEPVLTEEVAEAVNGIEAAAPPAEAFEAVKHVPLAAVDMKRLIAEHFEPFRVGRAAESSGGTALPSPASLSATAFAPTASASRNGPSRQA